MSIPLSVDGALCRAMTKPSRRSRPSPHAPTESQRAAGGGFSHGAAERAIHRGRKVSSLIASFLSIAAAPIAAAADFPFTFSRTPAGEYRLDVQGNSAVYFGLHHTEDLLTPYTTIKMALGTPGPIFLYTPLPAELRGFFRLEGIPNYAPADSDFDGMDDIWELEHPYLDPLNSADAFLPSPNLAGKSNLEEYRIRFGLSSNKPQYYSREMSIFNYGAVLTQAISRELGVFNFGAAWEAALSRELTVFNGDAPPIAGYPQIYSREVSLFNFGSLFSSEALSRELSVFNGDAPPVAGYPEIYSREMTVFNDGAPITSAISREVSVFNNIPQ